MNSSTSKTKPCQYLCLKRANGRQPGKSWETREAPVAVSQSHGGRLTLNFGESPSVAAVVTLSSILMANVPEKYYLTKRACEGILRRAATRGKAVAKQHIDMIQARLREEKSAKNEDMLTSLQLTNEMLCRGYAFLPIELGKSLAKRYVVEDGKVRLPFSALKGVGETAATALESATIAGQKYLSIEELQQATGVSSAVVEAMERAGALSHLPKSNQISFI